MHWLLHFIGQTRTESDKDIEKLTTHFRGLQKCHHIITALNPEGPILQAAVICFVDFWSLLPVLDPCVS